MELTQRKQLDLAKSLKQLRENTPAPIDNVIKHFPVLRDSGGKLWNSTWSEFQSGSIEQQTPLCTLCHWKVEKESSFDLHCHGVQEIMYILEGVLHLTVPYKKEFRKGDSLVLNSFEEHAGFFDKETEILVIWTPRHELKEVGNA